MRSKAGFLLLLGVIPRRPLRLLPKTKKKPPRNYDIYLSVVLEELRDLFRTGRILSSNTTAHESYRFQTLCTSGVFVLFCWCVVYGVCTLLSSFFSLSLSLSLSLRVCACVRIMSVCQGSKYSTRISTGP